MRAGAVLRRRSSGYGAALGVLLAVQAAYGQLPGPGGGADSASPPLSPAAEPTADAGSTGLDEQGPAEAGEEKLPFRGSTLALDNSASTQTLGLGADYQSRNPTYEIALALRARYLLWEEQEKRSLGIGGTIALVHEFTSSDATTDRGEWTLTDAELVLGYSQELAASDGYRTLLLLGLPALSFPTSKVSAESGKILGAGVNAGLTQTVPIRKGEALLPSARVRARAGYSYQFTRAVVPTNEGIERVRVDPLGRSIPSDQLSGAAFAQHQGTIAIGAGLDISKVVTWDVELGWRPAYKYDLDDEVEVCGVVATGCVTAEPAQDPPNLAVITLFQTEVVIDAPKPVAFSFGYENVSLQLGPDGRRRNMLYSPEARVFASVLLHLDDFYRTLNPSPNAKHSARSDLRRVSPH